MAEEACLRLVKAATMSAPPVLQLEWEGKGTAEGTTAEGTTCGTVGLAPGNYPGTISQWHDVRLRGLNGMYSFVVEIAQGELTKAEIALTEPGNPVRDNEKASAKLRQFGKKFGQGVPFNYGIFPQTFADPEDKSELEMGGDNAPLDCVEIGGKPLLSGASYEVVVLGGLCVRDKGELDWKIFTVSHEGLDALLSEHGCLGGFEIQRRVGTALSFFKLWYELKGLSEEEAFPYGIALKPRSVVLNRIYKAHLSWQRLLVSGADKFWVSETAKCWFIGDGTRDGRNANGEADSKRIRVGR